jgi:hypothetical protein
MRHACYRHGRHEWRGQLTRTFPWCLKFESADDESAFTVYESAYTV